MFLGPVEHDHRRRHFGQAANLAFLSGLPFVQNNASVGIDDGVGSRGVKSPGSGQAERQRKKREEKAASNCHEKVKPLHLNRRGLVGNRL